MIYKGTIFKHGLEAKIIQFHRPRVLKFADLLFSGQYTLGDSFQGTWYSIGFCSCLYRAKPVGEQPRPKKRQPEYCYIKDPVKKFTFYFAGEHLCQVTMHAFSENEQFFVCAVSPL